MVKRNICSAVQELALRRAKMAFISGPRQVGKTTLSQQIGQDFSVALYKNWDQDQVARDWAKNPELLIQELDFTKAKQSRLLILDEIHKSKSWKNKLKGLYDVHNRELKIVVTGSSRLNVYKRGGDSLLGRYLNFRLHPLSLGELCSSEILDPMVAYKEILTPSVSLKKDEWKVLDTLFKFSGFPEPYLEKKGRLHAIWRRNRRDLIIREDLRDLNRVQEISQLHTLALLLPERVGSPMSVDSLREDLSTSHDSVKRWLGWFQDLYVHFEVKPWSKSIKRSLKKEAKIYLYDWTEIEEPGPRFENLIASHLLKACHVWTDQGFGDFILHYLRNKEKEEIDFLIVKDRKPWLAIEVKLSETKTNQKIFDRFGGQIGCPIIQVVKVEDTFWKDPKQNAYVMSAPHLLRYLP